MHHYQIQLTNELEQMKCGHAAVIIACSSYEAINQSVIGLVGSIRTHARPCARSCVISTVLLDSRIPSAQTAS